MAITTRRAPVACCCSWRGVTAFKPSGSHVTRTLGLAAHLRAGGAELVEIVDLPEDNDMYQKGERRKCRYLLE